MRRAAARLLALLAVACTPVEELADHPCPDGGTKLTYDTFGASYLSTYCQACHGATGADRQGAPEGYDFGTRAGVLAHRDRIFARAADDNVSMPPGPDDPPRAERTQLAEWLACGAP